jgi:Holliday junction resolvasome RuvABC endonuclease subunit
MRVLGLDEGMSGTGYAILDFQNDGRDVTLVCYGVAPLSTRTGQDAIVAVAEDPKNAVTLWAHEMQWSGVRKGRSSAEARYVTGGQSQSIGILKVLLRDMKMLPPVAPTSAKLALAGSGRADKEQMIRAARWRFGLADDVVLSEHEADAMGIAMVAGRKECERRLGRSQELFGKTGTPRRAAIARKGRR